MTPKEAISYIRNLMSTVEKFSEKEREACEMAIEALKNSMAKRTVHGHWDVLYRCRTHIPPFKGLRYACSVCKHKIDVTDGFRVPNYCEECGAKNEM